MGDRPALWIPKAQAKIESLPQLRVKIPPVFAEEHARRLANQSSETVNEIQARKQEEERQLELRRRSSNLSCASGVESSSIYVFTKATKDWKLFKNKKINEQQLKERFSEELLKAQASFDMCEFVECCAKVTELQEEEQWGLFTDVSDALACQTMAARAASALKQHEAALEHWRAARTLSTKDDELTAICELGMAKACEQSQLFELMSMHYTNVAQLSARIGNTMLQGIAAGGCARAAFALQDYLGVIANVETQLEFAGNETSTLVEGNLLLGQALVQTGFPVDALEAFDLAFAFATAMDDFKHATIATLRRAEVLVTDSRVPLEDVQRVLLQALRLSRQKSVPYQLQIEALVGCADLAVAMEQLSNARQYIKQGLKLREYHEQGGGQRLDALALELDVSLLEDGVDGSELEESIMVSPHGVAVQAGLTDITFGKLEPMFADHGFDPKRIRARDRPLEPTLSLASP